MKKLIAILSILALAALVAGPSMAGNSLSSDDADDTVVDQNYDNSRRFRFRADLWADLYTDINIAANSGNSSVISGGDVGEDGSVDITTGDVSFEYTEESDVNGVNVYSDVPALSGNSNDMELTDSDDSVFLQNEVNDDRDDEAVDSDLEESYYFDGSFNSGGNNIIAADDVDQASIDNGDVEVRKSRFVKRNIHLFERRQN